MKRLREQHCKPCEGGVSPLSVSRITLFLEQVPGWQPSEDGKSIKRSFKFKGFFRTMSFVNALAWIANQQGHHPDFSVGYHYCEVQFTTHAIGGLSENDFICASRVNALMEY
ncbi:MAG: 4a-hydroxytetrahydrobiopterin dehydratase [Rhodothermales bacterium]